MTKVAIVTGGSSGIGHCTAAALKKAGCAVYEFSRREIPAEGINHITADITDEAAVKAAVTQVIALEGKIDILVNNAGFGISGAAELTDPADSKAQLELNLFALDKVTRAVIPVMRENGGGRIVCMSSIAGILPIPFQLWYSVSKAAINAYVLALANELRPFGISVCAVMPGDIRSGFTAARKKTADDDKLYDGRIRRSVSLMERDERNGMSSESAGAYIAKIALKNRVKPLYALGFAYKAAATAARLLPRQLSNYVIGMIYAR